MFLVLPILASKQTQKNVCYIEAMEFVSVPTKVVVSTSL